MLPGPVFQVELVTTARRGRYYFLRTFYGAILLFLIWQNYQSYFWWWDRTRNSYTIQAVSEFAMTTASMLAMAQLVAVLLMTPILVAPVIVDEKQRKTLHYLLASRLSSAEVVLGKLMARLLHVAVYLAIMLPVLCLMTLFGGVPPELAAAAFAGTMTTAFFVAGISIWISTVSQRVRDAILTAYLVELAWLIIPPMLATVKVVWPGIDPWLSPVNEWFLATNPFYATMTLLVGLGSSKTVVEPLFWMMGLQTLAGLGFMALAVVRLRPIFRKQGGEAKRSAWTLKGRRFRLFSHPPVGDAAMLWKELHVARSAGISRIVVRLLMLIGITYMMYWVVWYTGPAVEELLTYGFGGVGRGHDREDLNACLRACTTILYIIWALAVGAGAASSVTSEREEDTWTSLTTTMLTGGEILAAKMLGAIWSARLLGALMLMLWGLGLVTGAIHPLGLIATALEVAAFTWFAASLGTFLSLRARNTTRATAGTIALMIVLNGGYMMCCIPLRPDSPVIAAGCTPAIVAVSLASYRDITQFFLENAPSYYRSGWRVEMFFTGVLGLVGYAAAALALTTVMVGNFDKAIDRPRRLHWGESTEKPLVIHEEGEVLE